MTTENNVAAQAGDEPMRLEWSSDGVNWHVCRSAPPTEGGYVVGVGSVYVRTRAQVSPRATADVERDAARYQFMRNEATGNFLRFCPYGAPDEIDKAIDAAIATTKPGA